MARQGSAWQRFGWVRFVLVRLGRAGCWLDQARSGKVRSGKPRSGEASRDLAELGGVLAWLGLARFGVSCQDGVLAGSGLAWLGLAWLGVLGCGRIWQGLARSVARPGLVRLGAMGFGEA